MNILNCDLVKAAPLQLSETRLSVQVSLMNSDPLHQHLHTYKRLKNTAYSESCSQFHSCRLNAEWKKDKRQERAIMQHSDKKKKTKNLKFIPKGFSDFTTLEVLTATEAHDRLNSSLVLSLQL